jgi:uncharacterized membrane protein YgcG
MDKVRLNSKKAFKLTRGAIAACIGLLVLSLSCWATTIEEASYPQKRDRVWVSDTAHVLTQETEKQLDRAIARLKAETTIEITVVTVKTANPSPKALATNLFNQWKVGKAGYDNGILILISVDDRWVEIRRDKGIRAILPKAQTSDIIENKILPYFEKENFNRGSLEGVETLISVLNEKIVPASELDTLLSWERPRLLFLRLGLTASIAISIAGLSYFFKRLFPLRINRRTEKISVESAKVNERSRSGFLDWLLIAAIQAIVMFVTAEPFRAPLAIEDISIPGSLGVVLIVGNLEAAFLLCLMLGWTSFGGALFVYRIVTQACFGCTLGQLLTGMRIVKADTSPTGIQPSRLSQLEYSEDDPISWISALSRNIVLIFDGFFIYLVGALSIGYSNKSQRLGDRVAGTIVIVRFVSKLNQPRLKMVWEVDRTDSALEKQSLL